MSEDQFQRGARKVVHLDPFAQLERALLEGKAQEKKKEEEQEKIPLQETIFHSTIQKDEMVNDVYTPLSYSKPENTKQIKQNHALLSVGDSFERELHKIYQQQESLVLCVPQRNELIKTMKMFIQYCQSTATKIIIVSSNKQQSFILQHQLAQSLKSYEILYESTQKNHTNIFCWITTISQLRRAIFQQMNALGRYALVIFESIDLNNPIFEEILITLPLQLNYYLFYSYEMDNIDQVMNWLAKLRVRPFHLIRKKEPQILPIVYGMTAKSKGIYQIATNTGEVNHSNIQKINQNLYINQYSNSNKKNETFQHSLKDTVKLLYSLDKCPTACLVPTKRNVEKYARLLCQSIDLATKVQKQTIQLYLNTCITINPQLKDLKSFNISREYLARGIGMYHEGLLPIIREIVLLLTKKRLLKVVVAQQISTSMEYGSLLINYDEPENKKSFNDFKQNVNNLIKAHRADQRLILLYFQNKIENQTIEEMISKQKKSAKSTFNLKLFTYLNYLSFQDMDPEYVLARSFKQLQNYNKAEQLKQKQRYLMRQIDSIVFEDVEPVRNLHLFKQKKKQLQKQILKRTNSPQNVIPYLSVGRLVHLQVGEIDWGIGVVINFMKLQQPKNQTNYFVDALVFIKDSTDNSKIEPGQMGNDRMQVVTFDLSAIKSIKTVQFTQLPNNIKQPQNKSLISRSLKKLLTYQLNAVKIQVNDRQTLAWKKELNTIVTQLTKLEYLQTIYCEYLIKNELEMDLNQTRSEINHLNTIQEKDKLKIMHKIAKHMEYVSKKRLNKTGKAVACIQSRFAIMIVELMKEHLFQKYSGTELAALIISLVEDQRVNTQRLKASNLRLRQGLNLMFEKTKEICKLLRKQKLQINEDQQIEFIKQQYMDAIMRACEGHSLDQISNANSIYEGTLLQIIGKLIILLQQMKHASSLLHLKTTQLKIDEALTRLSKMTNYTTFSLLL